MITSKHLKYGVAALVVAGLAFVAGVPAYFLVVLICPLMMFVMMSSMSGGKSRGGDSSSDSEPSTKTPTP